MRTSNHNGRIGKNGATFKASHNDRQFDLEKAEHIDQAKQDQNIIIKNFAQANNQQTLEEYEQSIYARQFEQGQAKKNERYKAQGHKEKMKPVESLYTSKRTCPEEVIKQIGKMGDTVDPQLFEKVMKTYMSRFNKMYGSNVLLLDVAIHNDEATPHAHCRRVFVGHDKEGNLIPNEAAAMRELGINAPNPNEPIGRYNNAKMSFTEQDRSLFNEVCIEFGLEIEEEPIKGKQALSLAEYKLEAKKEELYQIGNRVNDTKKQLSELLKQGKELAKKCDNLKVAEWLRKEDKDLYNVIVDEIRADMEEGLEQGFSPKRANIEH